MVGLGPCSRGGVFVCEKRFSVAWSAPLFSAWRMGMSVGSCWPSASRRTAYWASAARAALMSVFTAVPYPMSRRCLTKTAPASSATLAVASLDPSSTTITKFTNFFASLTTFAMVFSSL